MLSILLAAKYINYNNYVGQTSQKCRVKMNIHKFDIKHYPNTFTSATEHLNFKGHSLNNVSFMSIDKINTVLPDRMSTTLLY